MITAIRGCMKQSDAYKLLAAFMISIMIIVPIAYMVTSQNVAQQTPAPPPPQDKYNPEYWVVNQPFYSISDALNMTPSGAITADYVDLGSMTPQMIQWVRTEGLPIINEVDSLYKSNTTIMYYASLPSFQKGVPNFLLLSTMFPEKNDFDYIVLPDVALPILRRQDTGAINIMGNPTIYTNDKTAGDVLNIIYSQNKTTTAYDQYEGLLSKVEPAQFQIINSNVSFANQFYMGVGTINETYERTTAYLNINSSIMKKLSQLKTNSTQRGFEQYNITRSGNYTIVKIASPDLLRVVNEQTS
jgi:hypothetical protein